VSTYVAEQKQRIQAKINKLNGTFAADNARERSRLLKMCEELVREHPTLPEEIILKYCPEYGTIIGLVLDGEDDDS
jgi:hypothetical protein